MWVKFTAQFRYRPKSQVVIRYPEGATMNVPSPAGEKAIAEGKALAVKKGKARGVKDSEPRTTEQEAVTPSAGRQGNDPQGNGGVSGPDGRDDEVAGSDSDRGTQG